MTPLLSLLPALLLSMAPPLEARISTDQATVQLGDELTVTLEVVRSGPGGVPDPDLPDDLEDAFDVGRCSTGFRQQFGTFGAARSSTMSCPLVARKAGKHKLAFSVGAGGTTVRSNIVVVNVTEGPEPVVVDPTATTPTAAMGTVFLWASADKVKAFVGEQVTYRLDVYEGRDFLEPQMRTPPSFQDFFAEELPPGEMTVTELDGRRYRVRPGIVRALFPQRAGTLTIGAAEVVVGRRRVEKSAEIEIEVVPLPAEGQPPGFPPNNVGEYEIAAAVDRDEVQPGEPFTLTVTIEGSGNIDVLDPGKWPRVPGVRRYDPKTDTQRHGGMVIGGVRTWEFLLIPERPGTLTIPAHELAYFDPVEGRYKVAKSEPVSVLVGGDPNAIVDDEPEERTDAVGVADPLAPVITGELSRRLPRPRWLDQTRWGYGMVLVPLLALLGLGGGALWRRFGPDEAARARAATRRRRRERIGEANAALGSGDGFHAVVASLLQEVALERAGPDGVGLPRPDLLRLLDERGVDAVARRRLETLLEQCDAARFANETGSESERQALLDDALGLMREIAR